MFQRIRQILNHHYHNPNYLFLLITLVIMIAIPPLGVLFEGGIYLVQFTYALLIMTSVIYTTGSIQEVLLGIVLGGAALILFLINPFSDDWRFNLLSAILNFLFFCYIFIELNRFLIREEVVELNTVYASISGYLILGIIGAPLFSALWNILPNAFNVPENCQFYDFIYFSFVTLTTVGFGDITPVHPLAKGLTLLIGIVGQLYLTILIAIIVGKYLSNSNNKA